MSRPDKPNRCHMRCHMFRNEPCPTEDPRTPQNTRTAVHLRTSPRHRHTPPIRISVYRDTGSDNPRNATHHWRCPDMSSRNTSTNSTSDHTQDFPVHMLRPWDRSRPRFHIHSTRRRRSRCVRTDRRKFPKHTPCSLYTTFHSCHNVPRHDANPHNRRHIGCTPSHMRPRILRPHRTRQSHRHYHTHRNDGCPSTHPGIRHTISDRNRKAPLRSYMTNRHKIHRTDTTPRIPRSFPHPASHPRTPRRNRPLRNTHGHTDSVPAHTLRTPTCCHHCTPSPWHTIIPPVSNPTNAKIDPSFQSPSGHTATHSNRPLPPNALLLHFAAFENGSHRIPLARYAKGAAWPPPRACSKHLVMPDNVSSC